MLTDEQKNEAVLIASVGCNRETAARYVGCSLDELNRAALDDADFVTRLRRAEAGCELAHMRAVQQAASEGKNWRASVWWLERRLPDRYAKRGAGAVSRRDLVQFLRAAAAGIAGAVRNDSDRHRVLEAIHDLSGELNDPLVVEQAAADEAMERQPDDPAEEA